MKKLVFILFMIPMLAFGQPGFKLGTTVTLGETDYNSHKNILLSHLNPPYQ